MAKSQVEVGAKLSVDAGNSKKSMNEFRDDIKDAKKALQEAKVGSQEFEMAQRKLEQAQKSLNSATKEKTTTFGKLKESVGQVIPQFSAAESGVGSLSKSLFALAANPIVAFILAIVLTLKGLYEAFASTYDGGKKLEQVFAGLGSVMQVIKDRLVDLASAVVKFFSGDFKGAFADAKKSVMGLGDEIKSVYERTAQLTKQLQGIKKEEMADELDKARRATRRALLREQLNDEEVSASRKKQIALELRKDEEENAKDDLARAKKKAAIQIELLTQQRDGARKNEEEINKINIEIEKTQTENALESVRTNKLIRNLEKQEREEFLAKFVAEQERKKEILNKEYQDLLDAYGKRKELRNREKAELINIETVAEQKAAAKKIKDKEEKDIKEISDKMLESALGKRVAASIEAAAIVFKAEEAYAKARIEIDQQVADAKVRNMQIVGAALMAGSRLVGEQTLIGKGLAIAAATIDTYIAAGKALKSAPPPFGAIAMGATIATGLANVARIVKVQVPGTSGGGGSVPSSAAASAPVAPPSLVQQSTRLDQSSIMGIGNAAAAGTVVIESQMTDKQERIAHINRQARLG